MIITYPFFAFRPILNYRYTLFFEKYLMMNLPDKLRINMMMVNTTAAAYALFCTSICGADNWKKTDKGSVAALSVNDFGI